MGAPKGNRRGRDTRARILAAGDRCFEQHGLALTLDEVAEAAGTTRMTVHRHTGGRERLITDLVLRASARLADRIGEELDGPGPLPDRLERALVVTVLAVRATPAVARLFTGGDVAGPWLALDPDDRVLAVVRDFYRPTLDRAEADGLLREGVDAEEAVAWLLAQALLVLVVPAIAPGERDLERFFGRLVLPAVLG